MKKTKESKACNLWKTHVFFVVVFNGLGVSVSAQRWPHGAPTKTWLFGPSWKVGGGAPTETALGLNGLGRRRKTEGFNGEKLMFYFYFFLMCPSVWVLCFFFRLKRGISSWKCLKRKMRSNWLFGCFRSNGCDKFRQSASLRGNLTCEMLTKMRCIYVSYKEKFSKNLEISQGATMEQQVLHWHCRCFWGFVDAATQGTPWTSRQFSARWCCWAHGGWKLQCMKVFRGLRLKFFFLSPCQFPL